jgi:hypothetical protein
MIIENTPWSIRMATSQEGKGAMVLNRSGDSIAYFKDWQTATFVIDLANRRNAGSRIPNFVNFEQGGQIKRSLI